MIKLSKELSISPNTAEGIKLFETLKCYGDIALFWKQENTDISVSMLDGNMIIDGNNADFEELKSFISMISPASIFASENILRGLGLQDDIEMVSVLKTTANKKCDYISDELSSKEVYEIIKNSGLSLPEYPYFATDYCLRFNSGRLKYFGVKEKAVSITIGTQNTLIHALASNIKGFGTVCLKGILSQNIGKEILVCASEDVKGFYIKNNFFEIYKAGYWRKK